jgi:3-hydroxyisobutyrate dehydrogenase-like beta-hydroxyacid dehydrogenase
MIGCIAVVSPGTMGSALGQTLASLGSRVVVALDDRSERTSARAGRSSLENVGDLSTLVAESDLIISVVPPQAAVEVATRLGGIMATDRAPRSVIDANAISPPRAREVCDLIEKAGGRYVDGGIVGGPPHPGGHTELLLSGQGATELAAELTTGELIATSIGDDMTAASTLKMCYAAWTKGTSALAITIRSAAKRHGVDDNLVELWRRTQPELLTRSENEGAIAGRAWRWVDEMLEIARTFEDAGLPGGFAVAAAQLFGRLGGFKDVESVPSLDELVAAALSPDLRQPR